MDKLYICFSAFGGPLGNLKLKKNKKIYLASGHYQKTKDLIEKFEKLTKVMWLYLNKIISDE